MPTSWHHNMAPAASSLSRDLLILGYPEIPTTRIVHDTLIAAMSQNNVESPANF